MMSTMVEQTTSLLMNGHPHELRVFRPRSEVLSGIYGTPTELAQAAARWDGKAQVYMTLNPTRVEPHPLRAGSAVKDEDVSRIDWLGIDLDPQDAEVDLSHEVDRVLEFLVNEMHFPMPVLASSGRGYWLLFRIAQENTPEKARLREGFLKALHQRFDVVDTSVFNAGRIVRLFGTVNLKPGAGRSRNHR